VAATAHAYCRRAKKPVTDRAEVGQIPNGPGNVGTVTAACPPGTRLISGGFQSSFANPDFALVATNMSLSSGRWTVTAHNNQGPSTITAHAYCMSGIKAPVLRNTAGAGGTGNSTGSVFSPACPAAKKGKKKKGKQKPAPRLLSAGGFSVPAPPSVPTGVVVVSRAEGRSWLNTGLALSGTTPVPMTTQGICV
jgi:hypothetical protein